MPSLNVHCAVSRERTGFNFKELHQWIDEPYRKYGINHRIKRHSYNKEEAKIIREFWDDKLGMGWGDKAVVEWLFHISLDNLDTAFKKAKKVYRKDNVYNFFKFGMLPDSKFIYFDFSNKDNGELSKEFRESYENDGEEDED